MKQITMESVKHRIADLESAGKVVGGLSLSSEFELACLRELVAVTEQRDAVVAECALVKSKGRELLGEACAVYAKLNKLIDPAIGDFIDGQTLHEFQFVLDVESTATSAAIAALRAEGVEMFAKHCTEKSKQSISSDTRDNWWLCGEHADDFARQLRESKGANHE